MTESLFTHLQLPSSLINNLYLYTTNTYHVHHTNSLR